MAFVSDSDISSFVQANIGNPQAIADAVAFVSDALAPVFGNTVVTGGAVKVPVYSDGTNWKVG